MVNIIKLYVPEALTSKRPQIPMTPTHITIHGTANLKSTARNEAENVINNKPNEEVSFHYSVDDKEIYNIIPDNEVAWHAGDGYKGRGNLKSIGIEICETGDRKKTLLNTVDLVKYLMVKHNIPLARIVQHNYWSGKNCPRILRDKGFIKDGMDWNWFMTQIYNDDYTKKIQTVQQHYQFSDDTINYLKSYKYGKELITKLYNEVK